MIWVIVLIGYTMNRLEFMNPGRDQINVNTERVSAGRSPHAWTWLVVGVVSTEAV